MIKQEVRSWIGLKIMTALKAVHLARGAFPVRRGASVVSMEIVIKRLACVTVILAIMELSVAKVSLFVCIK